MIEINLLPDNLKIKQKKVFDLKKVPIFPIIFGTIGALVVVHLLLVVVVRVNKMTLARVKQEWKELAPKKTMIDSLKQKVTNINSKIGAIEKLTEERIIWAKKMNDLSNSMPSNIWLSSLSYNKNGSDSALALEGFAAGTTEEGAAYVARFIKALKVNRDFYKDFHDIELESMRRTLIDKDEVMNFKLICSFKEVSEKGAASTAARPRKGK